VSQTEKNEREKSNQTGSLKGREGEKRTEGRRSRVSLTSWRIKDSNKKNEEGERRKSRPPPILFKEKKGGRAHPGC